MYIYNITTKVDNGIADVWTLWQKQTHIPETMITGFFYDYRFYELLEQDEDDLKTFVIQYFARELKDCKEYIREYLPLLTEIAFDKWGNQFISFRTLLKSLN